MPHFAPSRDTIDHLITAVYPSFAMLAGMQLNLFSVLRDGAVMSPEQIGQALEVRRLLLQHPRKRALSG